jgi:hypothetical protein
MNTSVRLKNIEKRVKPKREPQKMIVVTENNGKYYQTDKNAYKTEFTGDINDPDLNLIILTRFSKRKNEYHNKTK